MLNPRHITAALLLGMVGCVFIWVAAPYNNFLLKNAFISDSYLPVAAVIYILVLVLAINPLLHVVRTDWKLNRRQLALIFAMLLVAAVLPGQGLLRMLPWSLAQTTKQINQSPALSKAVAESGVRPELFPDELGYDKPTPVSDQFLDELNPGASIPWDTWGSVGVVWLLFMLACWLLMIGVGLVLLPEWKNKERLPFPLVEVYRTLLPERDTGSILPAIFKERLFWFGAAGVLAMYAFNGLNHHTGGAFPSFPMGWQLSTVLTEEPWRYLPGHIKNVNHIYFVLVGIAFFMPNRVSFSIWFIVLAYGLYEMFGRAYMAPFEGGVVTDHRNGAMIAIALTALYLSWRHWLHVGRVMFVGAASDDDRLLRMSGWMVAAGALGMFAWLSWAGVPYIWSVVFVVIGFLVSVLIARVVAETGLPFVRITGMNAGYFMAMLPAGWLTGGAVYMAGFLSIIFQLGSRVSVAVMAAHAASVDEQAGPKYQKHLGYLMIGILVVGFVVAGAVHLHMGYTQPYAIDGSYEPLNGWGKARMSGAQNSLINHTQDYWHNPDGRLGNLLTGVGVAGTLQVVCMYRPGFPIHPVGMIVVGHYYAQIAWAPVLIGWLLKVTIIYYGGASTFRKARPFFMGLILGEIFSAVIWTAVPVILLLMGYDPGAVGHIPLLPR